MTPTASLELLQRASHVIYCDSDQENGLVTSCATSRHLNLSGSRGLAHQVDHCCIGPVLLRRTRNADLHPVAVQSHNDGPGSIGHNQQIYFDTVRGLSYRIAFHREGR